MTPKDVHYGWAKAVTEYRKRTLAAAYVAHPERLKNQPQPPILPEGAWINPPKPEWEVAANVP